MLLFLLVFFAINTRASFAAVCGLLFLQQSAPAWCAPESAAARIAQERCSLVRLRLVKWAGFKEPSISSHQN